MTSAASAGNLELMKFIHEKDSSLISKTQSDGTTILHSATFNSRLEAIKWILEIDPSLISKETDDGDTALDWARINLRFVPESRHDPIIEVINYLKNFK